MSLLWTVAVDAGRMILMLPVVRSRLLGALRPGAYKLVVGLMGLNG